MLFEPQTRSLRRGACSLILVCALIPLVDARQSSTDTSKKPAAKTTQHHTASSSTARKSSTAHKSTSHTTRTTASKKHSTRKKKPRGQQKIDSERAQAIQTALIREHYMTGEPTGSWNAASEEAMRRYQGDHGWQTKEVPDSRALISLGLGPSKDHLLNPDSAMTSTPADLRATPLTPTSHSADPTASKNASPPVDPRPSTPSDQGTPHPQ